MPIVKKNPMMSRMNINDRSRPGHGSNGKARWYFMKPEATPFDKTPDPNPVAVEKDHLGNTTKMTYQASPSAKIFPNADAAGAAEE